MILNSLASDVKEIRLIIKCFLYFQVMHEEVECVANTAVVPSYLTMDSMQHF